MYPLHLGQCLLDVSVPLKPVILVTVSSFVFISLCANSSLSPKLSSPAFIIVCCSALLCALYPLISFWYRASQNELGLLIRWKLTIFKAFWALPVLWLSCWLPFLITVFSTLDKIWSRQFISRDCGQILFPLPDWFWKGWMQRGWTVSHYSLLQNMICMLSSWPSGTSDGDSCVNPWWPDSLQRWQKYGLILFWTIILLDNLGNRQPENLQQNVYRSLILLSHWACYGQHLS